VMRGMPARAAVAQDIATSTSGFNMSLLDVAIICMWRGGGGGGGGGGEDGGGGGGGRGRGAGVASASCAIEGSCSNSGRLCSLHNKGKSQNNEGLKDCAACA
jgi:hypothetical protein